MPPLAHCKQDLPCFQSQVGDTFTTTNQFNYKDKVIPKELTHGVAPKAPPLSTVHYVDEPAKKSIPRASGWNTISMQTWGKFLPDEAVMRAEEKLYVDDLNTQALSAPMQTEEPILDIPSSAYFHGPMPDKAITQHFLQRKTTSAVIDASGQNVQVVEVPMEAADPNFYYLRDADGSRKILEVRDTMEPADMRAHGRAMDEQSKVQRVGALKMPSALKNQGMQSTCSTHFADPTNQIELIQRRAEEIRLERKEQAASAKPYGEQTRIIIPHVFKHEMGLATVDRPTEILMMTREQPKNPPGATLSSAKDLIYSSAPPPKYD